MNLRTKAEKRSKLNLVYTQGNFNNKKGAQLQGSFHWDLPKDIILISLSPPPSATFLLQKPSHRLLQSCDQNCFAPGEGFKNTAALHCFQGKSKV